MYSFSTPAFVSSFWYLKYGLIPGIIIQHISQGYQPLENSEKGTENSPFKVNYVQYSNPNVLCKFPNNSFFNFQSCLTTLITTHAQDYSTRKCPHQDLDIGIPILQSLGP